MAKKKTSFYHTRFNRVGINEETAARVLGVSIEQVKKWDAEGAPEYVERLLFLWDKKHVNLDGWEGFLFSRGVLIYKRYRFTPENLKRWGQSVTGNPYTNLDNLSIDDSNVLLLSDWQKNRILAKH